MSGEDEKYDFPETVNQEDRILGLPRDEFFVVAPVIGFGVWANMAFIMLGVAGVLWFIVRYLKKGQGSYWLLNFCYWYLPTFIFRSVFKSLPDSGYRHWRA